MDNNRNISDIKGQKRNNLHIDQFQESDQTVATT